MEQEKFKKKVDKILYEFNQKTKYVGVYAQYGKGEEIFTIKSFLVNWSSIGSVGVETTNLFMRNLKEAQKLAKKLNSMLLKENNKK